MTFESFADNFFNEKAFIVEILLPRCVNSFGVSPCTASGTSCVNCWRTCQDTANYDDTDNYTRLIFSSTHIPNVKEEFAFATGDKIVYMPTITSIDFAPSNILPGRSLGARSSVKVTLADEFGTYTSVAYDDYWTERDFDVIGDISFWSLLKARVKYFEQKKLIIHTGFLNNGLYDSDNFVRREYLIDSLSGPGENYSVTISAKDLLKLADATNRKFPDTNGDISLSADIDDSTETIPLDSEDSATLIETCAISGSKFFRIGDEILYYQSKSGSNITAKRGVLPWWYVQENDPLQDYLVSSRTPASAHSDGDTVQPCFLFEAATIPEIIETVTVGIDPGTMPVSGWSSDQYEWEQRWPYKGLEVDSDYIDRTSFDSAINNSYTLDRLMIGGMSAKKIFEELVKFGFYLNYDERILSPAENGLIKLGNLMTLKELGTIPEYNLDNILQNSFSVSDQNDLRLSQETIYTSILKPLSDQGEPSNYTNQTITADLDAENERAYGKKIERVQYNEWLQRRGQTIANDVSSRNVLEFSELKVAVQFNIDAAHLNDIWTGSVINVRHPNIIDEFGNYLILDYLVIQITENYNDSMFFYTIKALPISGVIFGGYTRADQDEYTLSTDDEKKVNAYYSDSDGLYSNDDVGYTYQ